MGKLDLESKDIVNYVRLGYVVSWSASLPPAETPPVRRRLCVRSSPSFALPPYLISQSAFFFQASSPFPCPPRARLSERGLGGRQSDHARQRQIGRMSARGASVTACVGWYGCAAPTARSPTTGCTRSSAQKMSSKPSSSCRLHAKARSAFHALADCVATPPGGLGTALQQCPPLIAHEYHSIFLSTI